MKPIFCLVLFAVFQVSCFADSWTSIKPALSDPRWAPAACLFSNGSSALIVGGYSYGADRCLATADIFDERANRFHPSKGHLAYPRDFAAANTLPDGLVLITGGFNTMLGSLATAELYDPRTDSFKVLPSRLSTGRELFTATTLLDGRILIAGGLSLRKHRTVSSADIFDPVTETFTPALSPMTEDRFGHCDVRLKDGRVLIAGGKHWVVGHSDKALATADIFDPRTNTFQPTRGSMLAARDRPTASLLPDGTVLIAGGQDGDKGPLIAEIYHPDTETFTTISPGLNEARMAHSATTLSDGRVMLVGGWSPALHKSISSVEIYDPTTHLFISADPLPQGNHDFALIQFMDGKILAAAGKTVSYAKEDSLDTAYITHIGLLL